MSLAHQGRLRLDNALLVHWSADSTAPGRPEKVGR